MGNRGSKPPYLLCLASLAPTHFLFCFWLPPCSLFSLQKIRHCRKILPLPILLVLPPLALSSPISHTPPVPYFSQDSIPCLPPTCQYETPKMVAVYIAARTQLSTKLGLYCAFQKKRGILKFKSQLTIAFFAAVNHLNGPLRKQNFTLTSSKGQGL